MDTRSWLPSQAPTVIRTVSPSAQWVAPEAKRPNLIFGPCRSASTPTARPVASEATRTRS
ncbi:Uncharacterised protein [Mycobacterium tuberculosis]|nr:Uncharacterised protein [Mycobacterium tuberculosis]